MPDDVAMRAHHHLQGLYDRDLMDTMKFNFREDEISAMTAAVLFDHARRYWRSVVCLYKLHGQVASHLAFQYRRDMHFPMTRPDAPVHKTAVRAVAAIHAKWRQCDALSRLGRFGMGGMPQVPPPMPWPVLATADVKAALLGTLDEGEDGGSPAEPGRVGLDTNDLPLAAGCRVLISGLQSDNALNGMTGVAIKSLLANDRWKVHLPG